MSAKITLIIPIYKIEEAYLRQCLDSILGQTCPDWQAVLIDDGSPDNSGKVIDEYAVKDSRFTAVHQENQGVSVARNRGLDETKTEWVGFVDPDDWLESTMVERILVELEGRNSDLLSFNYTREYTNRTVVERLTDKSGEISPELLGEMRKAPLCKLYIGGVPQTYDVSVIWDKVYRTDFINRHGFRFEPAARKGQDRVFNLNVLDKVEKAYYLNESLYHYRNDNESSIINRYNPNTVKLSKILFGLFGDWIDRENKGDEYKTRLYCWICTRCQEYMRLYYLNDKQPKSYREMKKELIELLTSEPYATAMKKADKSLFVSQEKIFLFFVRTHQFKVCKLLISLREKRR